jgi:hypothetical protein
VSERGFIIGAASRGAVMIDTERLFDSLNQAREFTVTEDHLKLLRHLCDGGLYWDPGEGYGAPYFGPKKPYGNSNVPEDVAEILEAPDSDWEWKEELAAFPEGPRMAPFRYLRAEAEERFLRLHVEAGIALKIALATGEFQPGHYTRTDAWGNDWTRD